MEFRINKERLKLLRKTKHRMVLSIVFFNQFIQYNTYFSKKKKMLQNPIFLDFSLIKYVPVVTVVF